MVAKIRNEYKEQKIHLYHPICFCYARRPKEPDTEDEPAVPLSTEASTTAGAEETHTSSK
jgi:hypothetical protein